MGSPVKFEGCNMIFSAPKGSDNIKDLECFTNGKHNVLAVELDEEEKAEFEKTGRIWVSIMSGPTFFPIYVGTETTVRQVVLNDGGLVWPHEADLHQREILREIHTQFGADHARRELCRNNDQSFNTAVTEIRMLLFNKHRRKLVSESLREYLRHVN